MSAGLPGLGLGGLFFILSALLAPLVELWRTVRGRSRPGAWRAVGRQFAQALVMIAAVDLALRMAYGFLGITGLGDPPPLDSATVLPLVPIGITAALLCAVLGAAKLAHVVQQARQAELPALPAALPRPDPLRALAVGGTAAAAFFGLLTFGASDLSPLSERQGGGRDPESLLQVSPPGGEAEADATEPAAPQAAGGSGEGGSAGSGVTGGEDDGAAPDRPPGSEPSPGREPEGSPAATGDSPGGIEPAGGAPPGPGTGGGGADPVPVPPTGGPAGEEPPGTPATPGGNGSPSPPGQSGEAGPPENSGPKDGSNAPEHAGPPENSGQKQRAQAGADVLANP